MIEKFWGVWRLVSYAYRDEQGETHYPFGQHAQGVIMYDACGMMSVQIMSSDRPRFASGDSLDGTDDEVRAAFEGLNTYYGRYEIDEAASTVTHHLEAASLPNRKGTQQVRHYEFSGNRLTLIAPPRLIGGRMLTGRLVWEKIE